LTLARPPSKATGGGEDRTEKKKKKKEKKKRGKVLPKHITNLVFIRMLAPGGKGEEGEKGGKKKEEKKKGSSSSRPVFPSPATGKKKRRGKGIGLRVALGSFEPQSPKRSPQ